MPYFLYITSFLYISSFAFTFQRSFCEKPLIKTTLCHVLRQAYAMNQSCGKIQNKNEVTGFFKGCCFG